MPNANIPPVKGEFGYYDSRMMSHIRNRDGSHTFNHNAQPHWLIKTAKSDNIVGCHYSLPQELPYQPFITCHGTITEVGICINV